MRTMFTTLALCSLLAIPCLAVTWRVPADAPTVAGGLALAAGGDTVVVACGTYHEHDVAMPFGVHLRSESGEPSCVTIDAQGQGRVMLCSRVSNVQIVGFTFTGGDATGYDTPNGGGMLWDHSCGNVSNCRFTANRAARGGGLYLEATTTPTIHNCRFDANSAAAGGGAVFYAGGPLVTDCEFVDNVDVVNGAGLLIKQSSPRLTRCLFARNVAQSWGGAIDCEAQSVPILESCTLVQNRATDGGGLFATSDCMISLHSTIVAFNTDGGGLYIQANPGTPTSIALDCSDVFGNAGGDYSGLSQNQTGLDGNISDDPLFCDAAAGDFRLQDSSPCVPPQSPCLEAAGAFGVGCAPTPVPSAPAAPVALALAPASPNPFNPRTTLTYTLPAAGPVRLEVFALDGARVAVLVDDVRAEGAHRVAWDGRGNGGREVPAGIYLGRLTAGGLSAVQRFALVR
jgi:hypothetical protein